MFVPEGSRRREGEGGGVRTKQCKIEENLGNISNFVPEARKQGEGAREAEIGLGAKRAHRKITIRGITTEEFYRVAFPPRGGEGY